MRPFRPQLKISPLYQLFILDDFLGHRVRHRLLRWLGLIFVLILIIFGLTRFLPPFPSSSRLVGGLFILLSLWLAVYSLEAYFRQVYFSRFRSADNLVSFDVGRFLYQTTESDLLVGLLFSKLGRQCLWRLGIDESATAKFLSQRRSVGPVNKLVLSSSRPLTLPVFWGQMVDENRDLADWLRGAEVNRGDVVGAAQWVERTRQARRERERWWTREHLGRIPGLAKDWAYGGSYVLDQYSLDLLTLPFDQGEISLYREAVRQLEIILARTREANALLVGRASASMQVIYGLTQLIRAGQVFPELEHKHPKLLRTAILLSRFKERQGLENELVKIFAEVAKSGNVILILDDLPSFVAHASQIGANLEQLLDQYLASGQVQVVALAESDAYHQVIEPSSFLTERFEVIQIDELVPADVEREILTAVEALEQHYRGQVRVTYPAVLALADLGERFAGSESAIERARDFLTELGLWARQNGRVMIGKPETLEFVSNKLGVPLGQVGAAEREKLLHLEKELHQRVVGQDQAIVAVANALRRNRAGIRNLKRPLGSFLFLGPTGVGKTETAKALAEIFFGGEERLLRLDMSEFRGPDALQRLIGSAETGVPGALAKLLRDEPYGVVLLDEFEKTESAVLDLFLQVLDEGFFSDMRGKRVNARNIMFIATSNAGAPLIWELVGAGRRLIEVGPTIVESLIKQNIFKPELLNRFDAVVIFNPLGGEESRAVARLLLTRLAERLEARGLTLKISEAMAAAVAERGSAKQFGARPMARYIQDTIEQLIADKLLAGELKSGQTITLKPESAGGPGWSLQFDV